jgi:hypothetical protein
MGDDKFSRIRVEMSSELRRFVKDYNQEVDNYFANLAAVGEYHRQGQESFRGMFEDCLTTYLTRVQSSASTESLAVGELVAILRRKGGGSAPMPPEQGRMVAKLNFSDLMDELECRGIQSETSLEPEQDPAQALRQAIEDHGL